MLKTSKLIIVLFFLCLITGTGNAQKKNTSSPFFFIQLTDPQFGFFEVNNGFAKYGDMEMVTTSAVGKPLAKAPSGIRVVKVYPDRIESVYYSLDEIPETIKFD